MPTFTVELIRTVTRRERATVTVNVSKEAAVVEAAMGIHYSGFADWKPVEGSERDSVEVEYFTREPVTRPEPTDGPSD